MRFLSTLVILLIGASSALAAEPNLTAAAPGGRRTVSAAPAGSAITLDGVLDEAGWKSATPSGDFVQAEPREGQPASEKTEVRIVYDADALYVGVECHDSLATGAIVNDIRKDFVAGEQDTFEILLDTFADRRNGFVFIVNPAGGRTDVQIANEGRDVNTSWDGVWSVATHRGSEGWSAEIRIPFKTLRFDRGADRVWGVNFSRRIRRKNEIDYWSPIARVYNLYRASDAGTLDNLGDPSPGRNLRIKPYLATNTTRGLGQGSASTKVDAGVDLKYGVTPSLTLDATIRPDFAQAEADEQQVNLTQFSLFFPEKREFFLENSGTFYFGDIPRESRVGTVRFSAPEEEMLLFFSRRIGLTSAGQQIPITAGGRLTGRAGGIGVGVLEVVTESDQGRPGDAYTVLRARHDVFGNSDVGAIFLSRNPTSGNGDSNQVFGADANFRFFKALSINSFITKSASPGVTSGDMAGKASIGWNRNFLHTQYSFLTVGDNFRDDIGYIKRTGIRKHFADFGVRPRPQALRAVGIREVHPHFRFSRYLDQQNELLTRSDHLATSLFFENGAIFEFAVNPRTERITTPFKVRPDQSFAVGRYSWNEYEALLESNHSAKVSLSLTEVLGGYWSGTQKTTKAGVTVRPSYHLSLDAAIQRSDISLDGPMRPFVVNLLTSRVSYAFSTKMFLDTLLQYNTDLKQFSANVRFDIIHRPLSDFFVVYNEQQLNGQDITAGRGLIVKYTHMLAF